MESDLYPELLCPDKIYPISKNARDMYIYAIQAGKIKHKLYIVFYGGPKSGIPRKKRTDRYILNTGSVIINEFTRRSFTSWMDMRVYHVIPNKELTFALRGAPSTDLDRFIPVMALTFTHRQKHALYKRSQYELRIKKNDPTVVSKREQFKNRVDNLISTLIGD